MKTPIVRLCACAYLASLAFAADANEIFFDASYPVWDVQVDGGPVQSNPQILLLRGKSYNIHVSGLAGFHSFYINDSPGTGSSHAYSGSGLSDNGITSDTGISPITFAVPMDAPDTLYYDCGIHLSMEGTITVDGVFINGFEP